MNFPHLDEGTRAIVAALGARLAPGISTWTDLFTDQAVLEAEFDDGATPYRGRLALANLAQALSNVIFFHSVLIHEVIDGADGSTVVFTSSATFTRADLNARYQRHYVSIAKLSDGRIMQLREYGSPLHPV